MSLILPWNVDRNSFKYKPRVSSQSPAELIGAGFIDISNGITAGIITPGKTIDDEGFDLDTDKYSNFEHTDLCEKIPNSPALSNASIYPLGGNLRSYSLGNFLSTSRLNTRTPDSLDDIKYTNSKYNMGIKSNWEGSFSSDGSFNDKNLIENPLAGFSGDGISNTLLKSVLGLTDRVHLNSGSSNPNQKYSKTLTGLTNGDTYCLSFYVKKAPTSTSSEDIFLKTSNRDIFISEDITISDNDKKFSIPKYYCRVCIRDVVQNGSLTLGFEIHSDSWSTVYGIDICGMCISKGSSPIEITPEESIGVKYRPLAFNSSILRSYSNWTVRYKRYVFTDDESKPYKDFVGGAVIKYPTYPNKWEFITVRCDNGTMSYLVSTKDNEGSWITPTVETSPMSVGGGSVNILLGGYLDSGNKFVATPGIYRDLMIFSKVLSSSEISILENSLMGVAIDDTTSVPEQYRASSYIKSSLFREIF